MLAEETQLALAHERMLRQAADACTLTEKQWVAYEL